jgi:hypothetical protein
MWYELENIALKEQIKELEQKVAAYEELFHKILAEVSDDDDDDDDEGVMVTVISEICLN